MLAGAISAYNAGSTGAGVKIAIIDSGLNPALPEFAGRIDTVYSGDTTGANRALADESGHGTSVAAVAAATRDGLWMHGVAFASTIVALRADAVGSCVNTTGNDPGCLFDDSAMATAVQRAITAGVRVINLSLGGTAPDANLTNAMQRAVDAGIVIVISAGNDGGTTAGNNADPFAAAPANLFPGMVIVAGSVGTFDSNTLAVTATDTISDFSNRAGSSANSTLFALGAGVRSIDETGARFYFSGTSYSAPTISGAVALMAQLFPNLTGRQIVDLLLRTADDLGTGGIDSTYGRGRLNITRAVAPVGTVSLPGSKVAVTGANDLPSVAGDVTTKGAKLGAIVLDSFDRAYAIDLAKTLSSAAQARPLERALGGGTDLHSSGGTVGPLTLAMTVAQRPGRQGFDANPSVIGIDDARRARLIAGTVIARLDHHTQVALGFSGGAKDLERQLGRVQSGAFLVARDVAGDPGFQASHGGSIALRHTIGSVGMTLSGESGTVGRVRDVASLTAAPYRWTNVNFDRHFGSSWVSLGFGRLDEQRTVLGGRFSGTLRGGAGAVTNFLDLEARRDFGAGFSAGLTARRGWTSFAGGAFATGAYGFDLGKTGLFGGGDRFGLRVSQPLRIESGGFALLLPTAYSYDTRAATETYERFSLAPRGREVDAELSYTAPVMTGAGWVGGNLFVRRQPGHYAAAGADIGGAVRLNLRF